MDHNIQEIFVAEEQLAVVLLMGIVSLIKRCLKSHEFCGSLQFLLGGKSLSTFIILAFISSCNEKKVEIAKQELSVSIDTVRIDSNNKILDLWGFLSFSDFNSENNMIFGYNTFDHSIDQIDLDKLVVFQSHKFEKEGPNGTGQIFHEFNVLKENRFFIKSFEKSGVFDFSGNLVQKIEWKNSFFPNGEKYDNFPRRQILVDFERPLVFGLTYDYENIEVNLDILSLEENTVERLDLKSKKSYGELSMRSASSGNIIDPSIEFVNQNDKIIVTYEFSSEILIYDYKNKTLKTVDYEPKLTPKIVLKPGIKEGSMREIIKQTKFFYEQVAFYRVVWDKEKKYYYRLSTKTTFEEEDPKNSIPSLDKIDKVRVFLSVFDLEFNLLHELEIPKLSSFDNDYFVKDGKIWLFINLEDNLGFVRLNID